jgi:hypothetical protein
LAAVFASTAESLSAMEPSPTADRAQASLAASLQAGQKAYTALSVAAGIGGPTAMAAARKQVEAAEAGVNSALQDFTLLGYEHT